METVKTLGVLFLGSIALVLFAVLSWIFVPVFLWALYSDLHRAKDKHRWVLLLASVAATGFCLFFWVGVYEAFRGDFEIVFVTLMATFILNMFSEEMWDTHLFAKPCSP